MLTGVSAAEVVSLLRFLVSWINVLCYYSITKVQHPLSVFADEVGCMKIVSLGFELLWIQCLRVCLH